MTRNVRAATVSNVRPQGLTDKERRTSIAEHHVLCFQTEDGKQLWDTVVPAGMLVVQNEYHGYAVPTPATDGKLVFALYGSGVLAALDFDGKIVWREELPHLRDVDNGVCASPVLYEDSVIVPGIQNMGLRALDKMTGKVKWEQNTKQRNTMSTPALLRIQGKTQLKWETRVEGVSGSSAIIVGDHVYRSSGNNFIRCWSMADGSLVHEEKAPRLTPSASPIATADGRIYFASPGKSYVIKANPKLEILAVNDLNDGADYTTPAVSNGRIYIKGKSYLWCIDK